MIYFHLASIKTPHRCSRSALPFVTFLDLRNQALCVFRYMVNTHWTKPLRGSL